LQLSAVRPFSFPTFLSLADSFPTAKILKRFIRQPRPVGAKKFEKTYGMPSTHSSSIAFFATYLSLSSLLLPLHPRVTSLLPFYDRFSTLSSALGPGAAQHAFWRHFAGELGQRGTRIALAGFFLAGGASVCWSRVRLGHHTRAQVLVGASLGSAIALGWMSLWLGVDGWSSLTGRDLQKLLFESSSVGRQAPGWLLRGVKEPAMVWERAVEDSLFVVIEAWKEGRWEGLKELKSFPLVARSAATGEL
jgi:dolichyldiphosphatase